MKRILSIALTLIMLVSLFPMTTMAQESEPIDRTILNFNSDWGYYRGDLEGAEAVDFEDEAFANVTIPHTMRLEKKHANGANSIYQGIGWYRRYFTVDSKYEGQKINIDFEGVMTDSDIYLNGEKLYTRNGGYIGFSVDITDKVNFGETNVLAIRVSSYDSPNTPPGKPDASLDFHYYGGIYRDVTMRITEKLYISDSLQANKTASGGVFVTYPSVSKEQATVNVKTHVVNETTASKSTKVLSKLVDKNGQTVAENRSDAVSISANGDNQFDQTLTVTDPTLWHPEAPYLYTLVSEVYDGDVMTDDISTKVGIRTIKFDGQGFYINGEKLYIRGANRHQSYQNIGDAAPNSMQRRDALQMKANGFNAVRATHYPQDPAFMDACDEVGLLVVECQPGWQNFTNTDIFYKLTQRDTAEMIRRDRNRPSVILWETSLNETGYSEAWAKEAIAIAKAEYPGDQMYTGADYGLAGGKYFDACYKVVDTGWNQDPTKWKDFDPNKPFLTREWGDYEGSSKALRKQGEAVMNTQTFTRQKYLNGNGYSDWGGLDANERIAGYFLWSWNDYPRGSTTQTLGSGTVDIDRYEKYCYYWFQSMQSARNPVYGPVVFIASTYSPTSSLNVNVYSNCDSVKLFQNEVLVKEITREDALKSVPNIAKKDGSPIFTFTLPSFIEGELRAEGILDGEVIETHTVKTPGAAARIEVEVTDRGIVPVADGSDLIPVHFKVVDANGTVVPDYKGKLDISVQGEGELVGKGISRIGVEKQVVESGIGFAFVRTTDTNGTITVTASAEELESGTKDITTNQYTGAFVPEGEHTAWVGGVEKLEVDSPIYENIAYGKPTTASTEQGGNVAANAVDDDESTRWCANGGSFPQWIQIDLKNISAIDAFEILWENKSASYKYTIDVSLDGSTWTTAVDMSKNTAVKPQGDLHLIKSKARYVRLNMLSASQGWASLWEFRIRPGNDNEEPGELIKDDVIQNIASSCATVENRGTDKLRDGVTEIGTGWLADTKEFPQSVTVEFNKPQTLLGSRIYWEKDSSMYTYDLEVSTDGETWEKPLDNLTVGGQHFRPETFSKAYENIRFAKVTIKNIVAGGDYWIGMAELMLYGHDYKEPAPEPIKSFDYLSNLNWESASADHSSVQKDSAVYGGGLVLNSEQGKKSFEKGLSADTDSKIVYNTNGKGYTKFQSYIGINANAGKQGGEAIFEVIADGTSIYTSPVMMRNDNCLFIDLDIAGVKKLELVAKWSRNPANSEARYNTHCDWADAKFLYADKTELETLYLANKNLSENLYTPESFVPFKSALGNAKTILYKLEATQEEVDSAEKALTDAIAGLIEINPQPTVPTVTIPDIENVEGKTGTEVTLPVSMQNFPAGEYKTVEGIVTIPDGFEVVKVDQNTKNITASNFDSNTADGKLRFAFIQTDGEPITVANSSAAIELMSIKLKLTKDMAASDTLTVTFDEFSSRTSDEKTSFDVSGAVSTVTFAEEKTVSAKELYIGDDSDLIPSGKKAVSLIFTGIPNTCDIKLGETQLYFNAQRSDETSQIVYVALVDASVTMETLNSIDGYTVADTGVQSIIFGNTDTNTVINAQDALNTLSTWLRKIDISTNDAMILAMNVSADSAINTEDTIAIVDHYISEKEFAIVTK